MRVLKAFRGKVRRSALDEIVGVLRRGGIVAYPTDTAYGLAADPENKEAVARIYRMKGRRAGKALPLIAGSIAQVGKFTRMDAASRKIAEKYWPGPLTLVLPVREKYRRRFRHVSALGTVAVRVPASPWARAIASSLGGPVTSTSANRSGHPAPYSAGSVRRGFSGRKQPDLVLDTGALPRRPISTIIRVRRGKIDVLRPGAVIPRP